MQSNCIREASKACFNNCCVNPLLPQPHLHTASPSKSATSSVNPRRDFVSAILSSLQPNANFTNHESLPSSSELLSCLKNAVPNYLNTVLADSIRAQEYYHLSLSNHVCLDYVGQGLFSYSQKHSLISTTDQIASSSSSIAEAPSAEHAPFFDIAYSSVNLNSYLHYGSQESEFQAALRKRIMRYMNLFEEDYFLVFTANQSSAFKLLADSYPFHPNQHLLTVYDYDNESVNLMIESAKKRGARPHSALFSWPNFKINSRKLRKIVVSKSKQKNRGLFAFPLQSRMTGSRYSYQWMNLARDNGWHVLLDASALGAKDMETLGLSLFQPDFLICSFFKIFGENPSGFCCLFIKKSSVSDLSNSSTGMGIVNIIPAKGDTDETELQTTPSSSATSQRIRDETLDFQENEDMDIKQKQPSSSEIVEVDEISESTQLRNKKHDTTNSQGIEFRGLDHADTLGLILISSRARYLINWLINALQSLRHPQSGNGQPLITIYGPRIKLDRGPALAFNVYDWKGERVDPILVQKLADRNNISLMYGCLKNIFFSENFEGEKEKVLENRSSEEKKKSKQDYGIGVVSVSLGMLSNFEDMYRVWAFVSRFLDADFVEKEKWRYTALNQTTVEV